MPRYPFGTISRRTKAVDQTPCERARRMHRGGLPADSGRSIATTMVERLVRHTAFTIRDECAKPSRWRTTLTPKHYPRP